MINTIRKIKEALTELIFAPNSVDPTDHKAVSMLPVEKKPKPAYTGIPAPAYLEDDEWFGPAPARTEKQLDYMVQEMEIKRQEREENFSVESDDIHERMYEIATSSSPTTVQLNPLGGSENFQDTGWMSGKRS